MEFLLTSTSGSVENSIPNTVIKKYTIVEVRYCSTFEEFDKRFSRMEGSWLSKGVNHKVSKGLIQREFPNGAEGHFIEINSIEELLEFRNRYPYTRSQWGEEIAEYDMQEAELIEDFVKLQSYLLMYGVGFTLKNAEEVDG